MQNYGPDIQPSESSLSLKQFTYNWGSGYVICIYSVPSPTCSSCLSLAWFPIEVQELAQKINHTLEAIDNMVSALELDWWLAIDDYVNLTLLEYKFLEDFLFQAKSHLLNKVVVTEDLLCRCFKLTASEITLQLETLWLNKDTHSWSRESFKKICKAGTGCGKCESDVLSLLSKVESQQSPLWKGKSPAEWILSSTQSLEHWVQRTRLKWAAGLGLRIQAFEKGELWIAHSRALSHDEEIELAQALQHFFAESEPDLCVYLTPEATSSATTTSGSTGLS